MEEEVETGINDNKISEHEIDSLVATMDGRLVVSADKINWDEQENLLNMLLCSN